MSARITRSLLALLAVLFIASPALAQLPPPAPEPGDEPKPKLPPPPKPTTTPARTTTAAPAKPAENPEMPAVRVKGGEWGFAWRFGGLATMAATGTNNVAVGALQFAQIAIKIVPSETLRIPIFFGTGIRFLSPDGGDSATDWGLDLGGGIEYHFRIWRRISPFIGGQLGLNVSGPAAGDVTVGIGLGPQVGIEYFFADRLSLQAIYQLLLQFQFGGGNTVFQFATSSGGLLVVTAYF